MDHRPATDAEIIKHHALAMRLGWTVSFRHFIVEGYRPSARNGVSHRQYGRSKLRVINGVPHVRHHGEVVPVTATATKAASGNLVVFDLRIKSEHLK